VKPYVPAYDIYLGEGDGSWQEASRYQVWTNRYPRTDPPLSLIERREGRVLRVPDQARIMHCIPAATPYHFEHLFGFWRTTGSDTHFIRAEVGAEVYYTLIVGTHDLAFGPETIAWYCPSCSAELRSETFDLRRYKLPAFWKFALEQVRAFNSAPAERTCTSCGHVHPPAYGMDPAADRDDERDGRSLW